MSIGKLLRRSTTPDSSAATDPTTGRSIKQKMAGGMADTLQRVLLPFTETLSHSPLPGFRERIIRRCEARAGRTPEPELPEFLAYAYDSVEPQQSKSPLGRRATLPLRGSGEDPDLTHAPRGRYVPFDRAMPTPMEMPATPDGTVALPIRSIDPSDPSFLDESHLIPRPKIHDKT